MIEDKAKTLILPLQIELKLRNLSSIVLRYVMRCRQ